MTAHIESVSLATLLQTSAERHAHLCPRQVLGVRMGLFAGRLLDLQLPQQDKRLLTIVETDGCAADGVSVATGCSVGRRTLRVEDYGKVAATFIDTQTGEAVRILPSRESRELAAAFAPPTRDRWRAQLMGYQRMPDDLLLAWQRVETVVSIADIVSRPDARDMCSVCQEQINNGRGVLRDGAVVCRPCAGDSYYRVVSREPPDWLGERGDNQERRQ